MPTFDTPEAYNAWIEEQHRKEKAAKEKAAKAREELRQTYTPNTLLPPREELAEFLEEQLRNQSHIGKAGASHYGVVELRELLDYLYGGPPKIEDEHLRKEPTW